MTTSIQKDALLAQFAVLAYKERTYLENQANLPQGWTFVSGNVEPPFAAFSFRNDTTGEVIVAYRGTDGFSDLAANLKILGGGWNSQFQQGMDFLARVGVNRDAFPSGYDPSKLLVTGHSLGGAIAQIVAQAYGLDGSTIDPAAARRIVETDEFRTAAVDALLPATGMGIARSFTNHVVGSSLVSGGTGEHLGNVSYIPSLRFTNGQTITAIGTSILNPGIGFLYAIGTDQFSNKHSAEQVSQALQLMEGAADAGTIVNDGLIVTRKITGWNSDFVTNEITPSYSQTEFEVRDKAGDLQNTLRYSGNGSERQFEVFDAEGNLKSTTTLSPSGAVTVKPVHGDSVTITYPPESQANVDGSVITIIQTPDGSVVSTTISTVYENGSTSEAVRYADGHVILTNADANGSITSRANIQYFEEDNSRIETITYADNLVVKLSYDGDGNLLSQQEIESGGQTLQDAIGQHGSTLLDALTLVKAIQSGAPLPLVASGLKVANDLSKLSGTQNLNLAGTAYAASGILSLMSLDAALERGDTLAAVTAGAQAVTYGATAYANFLSYSDSATATALQQAVNDQIFGAASDAIGVIGEALPVLGIINSLAHGDYVGAAIGTIAAALEIPVLGWAYAVYSIVDSLTGDDAPEIPDPWGNGRYVWDGNRIVYQAAGETGGKEAVEGVMNSALTVLNSLIERERQQNPGSQLGIIPNRMPSVGYDMSGYRYTDIDPLTGTERHPQLRFDTGGRPYNAEVGSPESYQSIVEGMIRSALSRGAIAPQWEVDTARLQTDAGDPKAGLTEEARAGSDGQLAAPPTGAVQTFRPVALDLDGDGIETSDRTHGVAFDVDDSGYLKQTAWVKGDDALLVLDRNYNGQFDSGKELFSNGALALSRRGLAGMAWVDANYDGRLTAADPVWNELKLWRDLDQDGQQDAGEVQRLDALGVTELNYAMGTFTRNGTRRQLASPDLEADADGSRVTSMPEGIVVEASGNGHLSLIVTRVDDKTAVEAGRDGLRGYEDTEIIVNSTDLLTNDTLGGIPGRDLIVTGLTRFRHGTGFVDANGFVHFTPEANYAGDAAGFDYIARATNGQTGTATVDVTVQDVNDAPTLDQVDHRTQAVYGYTPIDSSVVMGYASGGNAMYIPYAIQYTTDWNGDTTETIIYDPDPYQRDYEYHTTPIADEDSGAGRVVGADVDDPASSLTYEIVSQPQYGGVVLNADGSFQYTSWKEHGIPSDRIFYDGQYASVKDNVLYNADNLPSQAVYATTDVFQVRITDPHGASSIQSISVPHFGPYLPPTPPGGGGGGKKPIAVDLDGNGFEFVNVDDSKVFFDINGDGWRHRTAWVGKNDGLLAYDIDGDGKIDKPGEISFTRYKEGAQSDLEGLRAFDSNGDGRFDGADDTWAKFGVWQDANQNGVTDAGEFRTLTAMGIAAVTLTSDGHFQVIDGQTVHGIGSMTRADGSQIAIADVTFAYSNETLVPRADGTTQTLSAPPFSPNGVEIDGTDGKDLILGKNGNTIVKGLGGDDVIFEDGGNDIVDGGDGQDLIYAGADNDLVLGANGDDAIYAGLGNDVVLGGDGHDAIFADGGNDVVFGGAGNDLMSGGGGNDVLCGDGGDDLIYGESGNDALFGRDGNDELAGMDGNDRLDGGAGNDLLDGGTGADAMSGGGGNDTYVVDEAADSVSELRGEGSDTVQTLLDGYTLGANVENLTLTGAAGLTGHGNELANAMTGNRGNNTLVGGAGNDKLDGGLGSDTLIGGVGDDSYVIDNTDDRVVETAGEGTDTVRVSVSHVLSANVESLILTGSADIAAIGNDAANRLAGNAGNNWLDGGAGADAMAGGAGNDIYVVDNPGDTIVELQAGGIDSVRAAVSYVLPEHVENLMLTGGARINGSGNTLANRLIGNAAANVLDGAAGADDMRGGAGDDSYIVDDAGDTLTEDANGGTDTVFSSVTCTLSANVENLILTGSADIAAIGNDAANRLAGNAGNNWLDGGAGADAMAGGAGNDIYVVDNPGDTIVELRGASGGYDTVRTTISLTAPDNVEKIELRGTSNLSAVGNALDNVLLGNSGANRLDGGQGADAMAGGAGDDSYIVDNVSDTVTEFAFGGIDTLYAGIRYVLPEQVENLILTGTGNIAAGGNGLDNHLTGNAGDNLIAGDAGNDTLDGGRGNDTLIGGTGDDTYLIDPDGGLDQIVDTAGTDSVHFGAGLSLDTVALRVTAANGSTTAHVRVLNAGGCEQADSGFDFALGVDRDGRAASPIEQFRFADGSVKTFDELLIGTRTTFGSPSGTRIVTGRDDDIIVGGPRSNVIRSGSGNDVVRAGAGGDTIDGEGGNDYLQGGAGNDTLDGGCGNDVLAGSGGSDTLRDTGGSNALFGGSQSDRIETGAGHDFIAGGLHDDTIQAGAGANVIAFNRGDGRDIVLPASGASNTLSLGGGIVENELSFNTSGVDLVLSTGNGSQITLKDWYASADNRTVARLQVIDAAPNYGGGHPTSSGWNIERFDFKALVQHFDAARAANPQLSQWSLMNGLLDAHLESSDSAALGGELAARYAAGSESAIAVGVAQDTLKDAAFGTQAQLVGSRFDANVSGYRLG